MATKSKRVQAAFCGNCGPRAIRVGDKFAMLSVHLAPESRQSSHYHMALCKKCIKRLGKTMPKVAEVIEMSMEKAQANTPTLTFVGCRK